MARTEQRLLGDVGTFLAMSLLSGQTSVPPLPPQPLRKALLGVALLAFVATTRRGVISWPMLLATWWMPGVRYSAAHPRTGRLLRRPATPGDRLSVFALSHAVRLFTGPLAGWLGANVALSVALAAP